MPKKLIPQQFHLIRFTGKTRDWRIVFTESYSTKEAAYKREREIKAWKSRKKIEILIAASLGQNGV